jgi:oxygen-independent coproporphyrinogen-3 oxidase
MSSLYVHIPFCETKCVYCDFYSLEHQAGFDDFLTALFKEIELYREYGRREECSTIFLGGGTPSLLSPVQLGKIFAALNGTFNIEANAEITLEANPGTVDREKLEAYRSLGVNRLSFGVQSFRDDDLEFLSRIHDSVAAFEAVRVAREAGFDNVSIDLIYSLPGQTRERWKENLRIAVDLAPDHISAYSLIVEDHTPLARMVRTGLVTPNPVDAEAELYECTMEYLGESGYEQYEVSNYAKPGRRSRHNMAYWSHQNYLGFGPSSHSFWRDPSWSDARRWWNIANLKIYCERLKNGKLAVASEEQLASQHLINERIFLGLRSDGLHLKRAEQDFRFLFHERQHALFAELRNKGLAVLDEGALRLTQKGYLLCDEIAERLFL